MEIPNQELANVQPSPSGVNSPLAMAERTVEPDDELVLYLNKRVMSQFATNEYGVTELRLYYGAKEISFDEPELFVFGQTLAAQSRFVASTATAWGDGLTWPRVQGLLEQLLEEGVLQRSDELEELSGLDAIEGTMPSPLRPAKTTVAHTWFESENLTRELTGRPLELGYLEMVIPVFRVAHMSLDQDGRQVGEANVFPPDLRLDVPTHWRRCIYPGSRFMADRPMNVTALKGMRSHWGQMMAALLRIREAYLHRFPDARQGWTAGHLERLSTVVLAVPSYALMKVQGGVENGQLHPALSSLFRVTDGLRMTMHQMLFIPIGEPTLSPDAPVTSEQIFAYAERNHSFHSEHGVCAGPTVMIKEFFSVLVDGHAARSAGPAALDAPVEAALADMDAALDYGLYGLQVYASVFSLWPIMTRAYDRLWHIATHWAGRDNAGPTVADFRDRLSGRIQSMVNGSLLAQETWRVDREAVYADMYANCGAGLKSKSSSLPLPKQIAPTRLPRQRETEQTLRGILARHFGCESAQGASKPFDDMVECLMDYFSQEQAILQVACAAQRYINSLLGRSPPTRPVTARDIDIHLLLQGVEARRERLPYLGDELEDILGIRLAVNKDRIDLIEVGSKGMTHAS